jgi:dCTP deaminase
LELTNVGELPIAIKPGMTICQLFLHRVEDTGDIRLSNSRFAGHRKPHLGRIKMDNLAKKLSNAYGATGP